MATSWPVILFRSFEIHGVFSRVGRRIEGGRGKVGNGERLTAANGLEGLLRGWRTAAAESEPCQNGRTNLPHDNQRRRDPRQPR